jgi:hypothetical protein
MWVKLQHMQQLVGQCIAMTMKTPLQGVLRPSKRLMYNAHDALVWFLSDEVDRCMEKFKEEWESMLKIGVITREGMPASLFSFMALVLWQRRSGERTCSCSRSTCQSSSSAMHHLLN